MKFLVTLVIFLSLSSVALAQDSNTTSEDSQISEVIKENKPIVKKVSSSSKMQSRVKKLNQKKSNEIISIKAYRKSLNVKVKTIKLC